MRRTLEERRQLNGNFNIYMHEDLLQAILFQYIGVRWSVFWKKAFADFRTTPSVWKSPRTSIPVLDRKRLEYFVPINERPNFISKKQTIYRQGYFVSQLLDSETQEAYGEEGDEEADFEIQMQAQQAPRKRALQSARRSTRRQASPMHFARGAARKAAPSTEGVVVPAEFDDDDDDSNKPKSSMEAKQNLLHLLSAEILIQTRLKGELTCFRSQIDTLYPSLPHRTVNLVLEYLGVSQKWLTFFNRFLKAPLRFADDISSEPRQRNNGTPGSHVLSEVFGEVVLFCLDFQINQETGGEHLWRMQDDFWFWSSDHATCIKAWSVIGHFTKAMGLELNHARTGALRMARKSRDLDKVVSLDVGQSLPRGQIRWGMLYLNPESGRFEIDQEMVDKHVVELSRQLQDKTNNIFAWIQAWNSYAATFFTSNFGKPANCFGRQHVDNMLATHERIQREIFSSSSRAPGSTSGNDSGSVIEFLRRTIEQRFDVHDIPDGYFYFPTEIGGLEVRNPFIGLLQIRDAVREDPNKLVDEFEEAEKETYRWSINEFEKGRAQVYHKHMQNPKCEPEDADTFFSFEEFVKHREKFDFGSKKGLVHVFETLLEKPKEESIDTDET